MLFDDLPPPVNATTETAAAHPPEVAEPASKRSRTENMPATAVDSDAAATALARLTQHAQSSGHKYVKCVQLTCTLLQGGTLQRRHNKAVFKLLETLLSDSARVTAPEFRLECAALARAACEAEGLFNAKQAAALDVWAVTAVTCNALHTDDSYAFNAAVSNVKAAWSALPDFQSSGTNAASASVAPPLEDPQDVSPEELAEAAAMAAKMAAVEREAAAEAEALLDKRRDGLLLCVEIAFSMYKWPWASSIVDTLLDFVHGVAATKLSPEQRVRFQKTHDAVKEARSRRMTGGAGGSLDQTSFERGQARYANAEISIRKQVGALGSDGRGESCAHRLTQ